MDRKHATLPAVMITGGSILVGCGGGGGTAYVASSCGACGPYGSYSCCPSYYGAYRGSVMNSATKQATPVVALVDKNGQARMSGQDGIYYRMSLGTAAKSLQGTLDGWTNSGVFPNGAQSTSGTLSGNRTPAELNAAVTDNENQIMTLSLNPSNTRSSGYGLPAVTGTWDYSANGFTLSLNIQADGSLAGTDSNDCTYQGTVAAIDPKSNVYHETYSRVCAGAADTFSGMAQSIPAQGTGTQTAAAQIRFLADDDAGNFLSITLAQSGGSPGA